MPEKEKYQEGNISKIASITPTPTNFISNPCKFRGKTIEILGVLSNSGGMTTKEISDQTGIPVRKVWTYCNNGEIRGLFERKERWGWKVMPFGFFVLYINNNNVQTKYKQSTNEVQSKYNRTLDSPKKSHQLNLSIFTSRSDIANPERVVVGVLVEHYERTGEKYRYFRDLYHFCDETGVSAVDAPTAIARLKEEGCIYTRKDEFGWKIGLKVGFVERLKFC
jgi:hypothetical protein